MSATMIKYAAIPTLYNGVQFRSRLEARWAAMFDMLGWRWEYEPFDAQGYIPDFRIAENYPTIIEVKPIERIFDPPGAVDYEPWLEVENKIRESGILDYAILGAKIHDISHVIPNCCVIGSSSSGVEWCRLEDDLSETMAIGPMGKCLRNGCGLASPSIYCINCGNECTHTCRFLEISSMWKLAGNAVQYKGGR